MERFDKPDQKKHDEVIDKMKEVISKLEDRIKEECFSPKSVPEEKPIVDESQITIEPQTLKLDPSITDILKTDIKSMDIKEEVPPLKTPALQLEANDTSTTDMEESVVCSSPSIIEMSKKDYDDESTKSDIDMGSQSPSINLAAIEAESQPILVDIDAPLDIDQLDDLPVIKKPKKLKLKDFLKKPKKAKKEQKKKLLNQKWKEVDKVKNELAEMRIKMKEMMLEIEREKLVSWWYTHMHHAAC